MKKEKKRKNVYYMKYWTIFSITLFFQKLFHRHILHWSVISQDSDTSSQTHRYDRFHRPENGRKEGVCFVAQSVCRSVGLTLPVRESLGVALVLSHLDYGCFAIAGSPSPLLDRLQSAQRRHSRQLDWSSVVGTSRHVQVMVTPLLCSLHCRAAAVLEGPHSGRVVLPRPQY